jgi:maleylpyruvate isomerase
MPAPGPVLDWMRDGEAFVLGHVAALDDEALAGPSRLPGWDRAHVVGHLARNADALGNLLRWARTGVVSPMYASVEDRAGGIEAAAAQPPDDLRADVVAASARLVAAMDDMPPEAWDGPIRTARGRPVTGEEVPWMRVRESWVHAVDLGTGARWSDLPTGVVDRLVDEVAGGLAGRDDCPAAVLAATDRDPARSWAVGPGAGGGDQATTVSAPAADLLAWLIGRDNPHGFPDVPAWL